MINFENFHQATVGYFIPASPPDREPDFVSPARSVYWDMGNGVLRASDHWAGQHGCTGQRTCVWVIGKRFDPGQFASGFCAYEDLVQRKFQPRMIEATETDLRAAKLLLESGGALLMSEWIKAWGSAATPRWAGRFSGGLAAAPAAAQHLLKGRPGVMAVSAQSKTLHDILENSSYMMGHAMLPEWPEEPPSVEDPVESFQIA